MFAPEYEPEKLKDELGDDFQGCLLPDSSIEFILNRYAVSLHKTLKLHKFELLRRTGNTAGKLNPLFCLRDRSCYYAIYTLYWSGA